MMCSGAPAMRKRARRGMTYVGPLDSPLTPLQPSGLQTVVCPRFSSAARREIAALEQARGSVAEHEPPERRPDIEDRDIGDSHEKGHQRADIPVFNIGAPFWGLV